MVYKTTIEFQSLYRVKTSLKILIVFAFRGHEIAAPTYLYVYVDTAAALVSKNAYLAETSVRITRREFNYWRSSQSHPLCRSRRRAVENCSCRFHVTKTQNAVHKNIYYVYTRLQHIYIPWRVLRLQFKHQRPNGFPLRAVSAVQPRNNDVMIFPAHVMLFCTDSRTRDCSSWEINV